MNVWCGREMGWWTVRLDGMYIGGFWREVTARRLANHLQAALDEIKPQPHPGTIYHLYDGK